VDPVTHAAFGYTAVRAVWSPRPRLAAVACISALAPDVDALAMPFGWDVYLRVHEVGTHALIGVLPVALAAFLLVRGRNGEPSWPLFAASCLGVLSHLALDVVSGARIRLGWPFVEGRTLVPLVAMAEPWVLALCVVGAGALIVRKERAGNIARLVLLLLTVCLAFKAVWLVQALKTWTGELTQADARVVEARWATVDEWTVFTRTAARLTQVSIAPGRAPVMLAEWPLDSEFPLAHRSQQLDDVRNLLAVHELTFAREQGSADGATEVLWSDVRFCWKPAAETDAGRQPVRGPLAIGTGPSRIACALWVGGIFDRSGRPITQRVQVFGLWQTRPAPR
jgi:membrane-bound metal-dependent hydrolase YbcI (DUF457 family)